MSTQISNKIEGVPDGWRLVAFRRPVKGEWFISAYTGEVLELIDFGPFCSVAIVVPDNVYGVDDPMKDVLAPHGYKAVAFRVPRDDEYWISPCGTVVARNLYAYSDRTPRVIIEPLPPPPKPKREVLICEIDVVDNPVYFGDRLHRNSFQANEHVRAWPSQCRIEERDA